jgi:hypothetical protein
MRDNDEGFRKGSPPSPEVVEFVARTGGPPAAGDERRLARVKESGRPDLIAALPGVLGRMGEGEAAKRLALLDAGVRLSPSEFASLFLMPVRIVHKPCTSSNVASYGVDGASGMVSVEFKGGGVYRYLGLSNGMLYALDQAESKGAALASIKSCGAAWIKLPPGWEK